MDRDPEAFVGPRSHEPGKAQGEATVDLLPHLQGVLASLVDFADGEAICLHFPDLRGLEPDVRFQRSRDLVDLLRHTSGLSSVFLVHQLSRLVQFGQLLLREPRAQFADALEAPSLSVVGSHQVRAVDARARALAEVTADKDQVEAFSDRCSACFSV